jgi:hypothetical protein
LSWFAPSCAACAGIILCRGNNAGSQHFKTPDNPIAQGLRSLRHLEEIAGVRASVVSEMGDISNDNLHKERESGIGQQTTLNNFINFARAMTPRNQPGIASKRATQPTKGIITK